MENKYAKSEFQIFFSGVESDSYFNIVTKESNAVLMSYLYIKRKGKNFISNRLKECPNLRLMVDSGVHTFLKKEDEYRKKPIEYWEKYLEEYTAYARSNRDFVFAIIELDLVDFVGTAKIEEWREKYFKPLEEEGIQVIYVWHETEGQARWEEMCKKYNYISFSLQGDRAPDMGTCIKMVNTAKRYGTRVHGLAATGMDSMQKIPFYTVDSTTWLVGTQFGEVNYFDGRTMKRLKKAKWKGMFKNKLIALGANWDLAEREEPYELIRINVLTFVAVEAYLRKIMKNKAYWLEGRKAVDENRIEMPKREVKDIAEVMLPENEWFYEGEQEDYQDYCRELGIDLNLDKETSLYWIETFYAFIKNDKETLDKMEDSEIFKLVDIFGLKSECNTTRKAMDTLPQVFIDHACGKRNEIEVFAQTLSQAGQAPPKGKERDEYLEEETHEMVEISKEEVESVLKQFLPTGKSDMEEVDAYDDEINKIGIVAVRDEKGRLLKGQKAVRKPKQIYSDLMPKLSCDSCIKAGSCPDYVAGYVCAFNKLFKRFDSRNGEDVEDAIASMVNHNLQRMQQQMVFEVVDGGIADPTVTGLIDQNIKLLTLMSQMKNMQKQVVATRRVVMDESGKATEVTETVSANPQQGGIMSRLFGGSSKVYSDDKEDKDEDTIDISVEKD